MEQVAVNYEGPSAAYSVEHDGEWYELARGQETTVPETLAERLLDIAGHSFEVGDDLQVDVIANDQGTEKHTHLTQSLGSGSGEGSGSGDDLRGSTLSARSVGN